MLDTEEFGKLLWKFGFCDFSGVPCSYLSPLINYCINANAFIMANNEGDAVAIASGISLSSDNTGVVLMQNSGLSNALSPITSLNHTFKIPILGFVSLRGERDSHNQNTDEPQHELLGVITDKLLSVCGIDYEFLSDDIGEASAQLERAKEIIKNRKSFFFIVKNHTFSKVALKGDMNIHSHTKDTNISRNIISQTPPTRLEALESLHSLAKDCVLLATTGKCGRELYEIGDNPNQFYMVGSMGCVSSLALGISIKSKRKVIAIDGDSALLMRLGALAANAFYGNFCHILLDNHSHDSTGGQFNLSPCVNFPQIALSCGYTNIIIAQNLSEFTQAIKDFLASQKGSFFIYLRIAKGSKDNLGRPKITPSEVAMRLREFIRG